MTKLEDMIHQLYLIKEKSKKSQDEFKIRIKFLEKDIEKILQKKDESSYSFGCKEKGVEGDVYYKATTVKPKKIEWNMDMLQQVLKKDIFNQICNKKYSIVDYEGFTQYLKSLGANPRKVKNYIQCEKSMNDKALNQLSELGEITDKDIEGCYTVTDKESYIRVTRSEVEEKDEEDS